VALQFQPPFTAPAMCETMSHFVDTLDDAELDKAASPLARLPPSEQMTTTGLMISSRTHLPGRRVVRAVSPAPRRWRTRFEQQSASSGRATMSRGWPFGLWKNYMSRGWPFGLWKDYHVT